MTKIAFSSDFHIDVVNQNIIQVVKEYLKRHKVDIFCFAGDMSANINTSIKALKEIEEDLDIKVLAITGNHEMWDTSDKSSFDIINIFNQQVPNISVMQSPYEFLDWVILGNMGWYDYSTAKPYFRIKQLNKMAYKGNVWEDKENCNWEGKSNQEVSNYLLNELKIQLDFYKHKNIILLSHIVPYQDYIVSRNDRAWDYFSAFIGNKHIGELADKYNVKITHFGHTHYRYHKTSPSGRKIICSPLGYEEEWKSFSKSIQDEVEKSIIIYEI